MTPEFKRAVGGMALIPQWFCWKLTRNLGESKYQKVPWHDGRAVDSGDPQYWMDYDTAALRCLGLRLNAVTDESVTYVLGFRLTEGCGYFFFDLDKCVTEGHANQLTSEQMAAFSGAMLEYSSSKSGVHLIGRYSGNTPHRSMYKENNWEFYTSNRGIAFDTDGQAWGSADSVHDAACEVLIENFFKPRPLSSGEQVKMHEWCGPEDDGELLQRIYRAKVPPRVAAGARPSVRDMMEGQPPHNSENDASLAITLAWWTGRDVDRIERIMRKSKLYRPKWDTHRPQGGSYLRHTILEACSKVDTCYVEPKRQDSAALLLGRGPGPVLPDLPTPEPAPLCSVTPLGDYVDSNLLEAVEALKTQICGTGTARELYNLVPAIHAATVPPMLQDQIVDEFHRRLRLLNSGTSVGKVRQLLYPPVMANSVAGGELPDWASDWCFVGNGNVFFNLSNNAKLDMTGFHATFGSYMPLNSQGRRLNAAEHCLHFWNMPRVSEVGYRPDKDRYYEWEGRRYANTYSPSSMPESVPYTAVGVAGIDAFRTQLLDMCGRREDVYWQLLYWIAHNVQRPGIKIRWSPVIKGYQGDGKGIIGEVIKAAMGSRNVNVTGNRALMADFTDWAIGAAVNIIEEIHLTGEKRYLDCGQCGRRLFCFFCDVAQDAVMRQVPAQEHR